MEAKNVRKNGTIIRISSGIWLVALGLAGDGIAGYIIIQQQFALAILQHVVAVSVWTVGIHLLTLAPFSPGNDKQSQRPRATTFSGWTIVAATIGTFNFPGIGTACVSTAFILSFVFQRRSIPRYTLGDTLASLAIPSINLRPASLDQVSQVMPLVDVLAQRNTEMRRAVIRTLGDQGDKESVGVLRGLLTDSSLDVRSDASVILTRLENDYSQRIQRGMKQMVDDPEDVDQHIRLAQLCYQFAENGLLDAVSRQYYLEQARTILINEHEQHPRRTDITIELARIFAIMLESRQAIALLITILKEQPSHSIAAALLLDIAFAEQDWGIVLSLVQNNPILASRHSELFQWWSQVVPSPRKETLL